MSTSRKEQEVIEQQRKLAAMIAKRNKSSNLPSNTATTTSSTSSTALAQKRKNPSLLKPSSNIHSTSTAKTAASSATTTPQVRPSRTHLKRPSTHSSTTATSSSTSASTILATARAKASGGTAGTATAIAAGDKNHADNATTTKASTLTTSTTTTTAATKTKPSKQPQLDPLIKVQRKVKSTTNDPNSSSSSSSASASNSSRFARLIQDVAASTSNNAAGSGAGGDNDFASLVGTNVSPDDFWKHIRDWDFVGDLASLVAESSSTTTDANATSTSSSDTNNPPTSTFSTMGKKPIPETFISSRHYVSLWAPLAIAETRAQLLSEVMTEVRQLPRGNNSLFVPVKVETTWKGRRDANSSLHTDLADVDSCQVQISTSERRAVFGQIFSNDIFCLVPTEHKDAVELLIKGNPVSALDSEESFKRYCLVGHNDLQRKEIHGLILKVSKRKWALVGKPSMYLLRIGGNVTALREFTALCRVDSIPLKKYLLGHHLQGKQKANGSGGGKMSGAVVDSSHVQAETLLEKMGGVQALGKGFTEYAQKKFNPSQLMAISASSRGYGEGGITLIKGPPGTGKTTTLVAVLNSLHIRQYNKYYDEVREIAAMQTGNRQGALETARKAKPRLLVCAPSNAAIDNIILKVMSDGFIDGSGQRYNPSMIRVGSGQSSAVSSISLETKINQILADIDIGQLESSIAGFRMELQRISADIAKLRRRCHAIANACDWPLAKDWEIRVDESSFDTTGRCFFVNHRSQTTTYERPPPPEPGEAQFEARSMPEYKAFMHRIVKNVENYFAVKTNLERSILVKGSVDNGASNFALRQSLESHVLNSVHMVMTTLGTAGNRIFEGTDRFEVVVVDEAAQSVEPATLSALQLGSRHCVLVGDPQQLPATIFNVSGRNSKYDRSLFQRLEEAGEPVHMLNNQYRMHPLISHFPRHIFYGGNLLDGPNVVEPKYGHPLISVIRNRVKNFQPFTVLDLDSTEERGGTSLSNSAEAELAIHLYSALKWASDGLSTQTRVALITPYSQQAGLLKRLFQNKLGSEYERYVEINTVDAFQGREANIVIFSAVRAAGSHGIGFLSDVRRMNVALTRAKFFLFVIARTKSIVVNPYWSDLVTHARENNSVVRVEIKNPGERKPIFGDATSWKLEGEQENALFSQPQAAPRPVDPRKKKRKLI